MKSILVHPYESMHNLINFFKNPRYFWGFPGVIVFILIASSCGAGPTQANPTPISTAELTATPVGSEQQFSTLLPPTQIAPEIFTRQEILFDTQSFTHPDGLFSMQAPRSWNVEPESSSVTFQDPESGASLIVHVVNTGYQLDAESLLNVVRAREVSDFADLEDVVEIEHQVDEGGNLISSVKKVVDQGDEGTLFSLYQNNDQGILFLDFLFNQDEFDVDQEDLAGLLASVEVDPRSLSELPLDSSTDENIKSNDYFSIAVPTYWISERTSGEFSIVDTYTAPDKQAIAQTLVYDDGQSLTGRVAGEIVLTTLREQYAPDISVVGDRLIPDGREMLTWESLDGSYEGVTTFETNGTALMVLTVLWENGSEFDYRYILDGILTSYTLINQEG